MSMGATGRRARLRRSDCSGPGLGRVRRGRGFSLIDERGRTLEDAAVVQRVAELAIPPAWEDVWICLDPLGHLQATGTDAAGRKQYLYHPRWREQRDRRKFREMEAFARGLPRLRRRVAADLEPNDGFGRDRVLACAVRLLDVGLFRIGGEEYAEQGGGLGLATIRKEHVAVRNGSVVFDYPAKSGVRRVHEVSDPVAGGVVAALRRRRGGGDELLAYRNGRRWCDLRSEDINDYIKLHLGEDFSAKDFRTWNATVLAAADLAVASAAGSKTARKRVINACVKDVAEMLGNTPTVARRSYIDPRVFDRYLSGWTIRVREAAALDDLADRRRRRLELAVLDLLEENSDSSAVAVDDPVR
jgi:DNA topoisomerase IB